MSPLSRLVVVAGNTPRDRQPIVVQAVEHSFLREDVRVRLPRVGLSKQQQQQQQQQPTKRRAIIYTSRGNEVESDINIETYNK